MSNETVDSILTTESNVDSNVQANIAFEDPTIQCEICQESIPFSQYLQHSQQHMNAFIPFPLNGIMQLFDPSGAPTLVIQNNNNRLMVFMLNGNFAQNMELDPEEAEDMITGLNVEEVTKSFADDEQLAFFDEDGNAELCPICYKERSEIGKENLVQTNICKHIFCRVCIEHWLQNHNQCPSCRSVLSCQHQSVDSSETQTQSQT